MRSRWLVAAAVAAMILASASCSSTGSGRDAAETKSLPEAPTSVPVTPSTVLDPSQPLAVPFTADDGALVVTAGPPPSDVTQGQAVAMAEKLLPSGGRVADSNAAVSGLVTLAAGLTHDEVVDRPAWIVPYTQAIRFACPATATPQTAPPAASGLEAMIILRPVPPAGDQLRITPAPAFDYIGAGVIVCAPSTSPKVLDLYEMDAYR